SSLSAISERLSSSYRSVSEFKSDVRKLFSTLQDDDFSDKLREEVRSRWKGSSRLEEQEVVRQEQEVVQQEQEVVRQEQEVVRQEQEVVRQEQEVPGEEQEVNSRAYGLSQTRKRLRELLMETARSKRARTDTTEA
ncbi:golgin subfamily A member 6-like protein 26, partial [Pseudochaenichthys georgianus]|uniref:golgin subfamily A member 6-like protein 26 n=1 Tax=Pseudochaenichthys georgianus TaxID=52239 RepID=UPI00146E9F61